MADRAYWFDVKLNGDRKGVVMALNADIAKTKCGLTELEGATATRINNTTANMLQEEMKENKEMATFMEMIEQANAAKTAEGKLTKLYKLLAAAEKRNDTQKIELVNERIKAVEEFKRLADKAKKSVKKNSSEKDTKPATKKTPTKTEKGEPEGKTAKQKAKKSRKYDDSEFEYMVRRDFTIVNGKSKWIFADGVPEGRFPVPPKDSKLDAPNDKQKAAYNELYKAFAKQDKAKKADTTVEKHFEAGTLIMAYTANTKAGTIKRTVAIYAGGRPAAWIKHPNGERRLEWGAKEVIPFGAYIEA